MMLRDKKSSMDLLKTSSFSSSGTMTGIGGWREKTGRLCHPGVAASNASVGSRVVGLLRASTTAVSSHRESTLPSLSSRDPFWHLRLQDSHLKLEVLPGRTTVAA